MSENAPNSGAMTQFELASIEIEQQKVKLELNKLELEKRKMFWSSMSIIVPVVVAFLMVGYGIYSNDQQSNRDFQLAIVKAIADEQDPDEALGKFQFFSSLFPGQLPPGANVDVHKYTKNDNAVGEADAKKFFFEQMRQSGLSAPKLLILWRTLFDGDEWAKKPELDTVISGPRSPR
jgi:hypothetical protein